MGTVITIPYRPRPLQRQMHEGMESHRWSVIVAHRRFGKTVAVINHLVKKAILCTKPDPRFGYVAPYRVQAKAIAWTYLKRFTDPIPNRIVNESDLFVELPNKAQIRLFGADNPDSMRGLYFDGVVPDEPAQMKPEVWGEILRPALSDREGWAVFIGTPKGLNLFSEIYYAALKDPSWYVGFFPADKTGVLPESELALARKAMSDNQFRQEFLCDFSASNEDTLIGLDIIQQAASRDVKPVVTEHSAKVMGVDVARFGNDRSVILIRHGLLLEPEIRVFNNLDLVSFAGKVMQTIREVKPDGVFIDEVGLGAGVVDLCRSNNFQVTGVNSGHAATDDEAYFNLRAEMWGKMRDWLQSGGTIPDRPDLKADLMACTYKYDQRGRVKLESKEDMKARGLPSPDIGDALALTFAFPVQASAIARRGAGFANFRHRMQPRDDGSYREVYAS